MYNTHTMFMYMCVFVTHHVTTKVTSVQLWGLKMFGCFSVYNIKLSYKSRKWTTNAGHCVKDLCVKITKPCEKWELWRTRTHCLYAKLTSPHHHTAGPSMHDRLEL